MSIILQPTLFEIDFLAQLNVQERHAEIFSPINFFTVMALFQKDNRVGPPLDLNYEAAVRAIVVRYIEGIPTRKALVKRLKEDVAFKLSLGFLYSDRVPSESTFCRISKTLAEHPEVLIGLNDDLLQKINEDFQIFNEATAVDATAVDGHTKTAKTENPQMTSTQEQRTMTTEELLEELTIYPSWGKKSNSQGKNTCWFGYKGHFAVSTETQYLLAAITTSAFVSDVSVAIPLIRKLSELGMNGNFVLMDKGYDSVAVYEEAHHLGFEPIIDLKRIPENDGEVDCYFNPTCLIEESYKYDSFDKRYDALKFKRPETRCRDCPLQYEGLCQKVIKIKQAEDVRKYAHPARGTQAWKNIYKERTSVERVNAYLKENHQLNDTTYYKADQVVAEHLLIQLAYNAKTYANQRLAKAKQEKEIVV